MKTRDITLGNRVIGPGHPVYIIAEIGYNFRDLDEAEASIDAAVDCGVDAVKFQTFCAETVVCRDVDFPDEAGGTNQFDEFKRFELSREAHHRLFAHARRRGIEVFSTPSYYDDVDLLQELDVTAYKIGSDDLTNLPFVADVAGRGQTVIFSTGMGELSEVLEAYDVVRRSGNRQVAILHCVSNYPVEDLATVNLRAIETLRQVLPVPIGFSDHTQGATAAIGAVALGACLIEKHFTLDRGIDVPDASFSADPAELRALVRAVREMEILLGNGVKRPAKTETEMRSQTRKGAVARVDIAAGEIIDARQVIVKRPGTGIPPRLVHLVSGRRARVAIRADEVITWDKLD